MPMMKFVLRMWAVSLLALVIPSISRSATDAEINESCVHHLQEGEVSEDPRSTFWIGLCYLEGWGVQKNEKEAHRLFLLAAGGGVPGAYVNLANMYLLGIGVSVDLIEAYKWIAIAHGGHIPAENGWKSELESKMNAAEITEARKRIQAWVEMHPLKSN